MIYLKDYFHNIRKCAFGQFKRLNPRINEEQIKMLIAEIRTKNEPKSHKDNSSIKVFSFNILRDYNPDLIRKSIDEAINKYDFDVLLFQEITVDQTHQINLLNDPLFKDYNYFFVPMEIRNKKDKYHNYDCMGVGVFSKLSFDTTKSYFFPNVKTFEDNIFRVSERCSAYVQIKVGDKKIGIYSIHLENASKASGRNIQTQYFLEQIKGNKDDDITIIGGDFNGRQTSLFETYRKTFRDNGFTDPYRNEFRRIPRLDRFFIRGTSQIKKLEVRGKGSDHQPIGVEVTI